MKYWIIIVFSFISNKIIGAERDSVYLTLALLEKKIFHSNEINKINEILYEKSTLQLEIDESDEAIQSLMRIDTILFTEEEKSFYHYKLSIARILSGQFDQALQELEEIKTQNDSTQKEIFFLEIFIQNELENFEECKSSLMEENLRLKCNSKTDSLLPIKINRKDPLKASHLSAFLPGTGQIYTGNFGKGLLSFGLTTGFTAFGVFNFIEGYYAMSVVSGLFPALKFYSGGKRLAENLAEKHNSKKTMELKQLYRKHIYNLQNCN
jgi:TM2 domain-containing membrane protein YozV